MFFFIILAPGVAVIADDQFVVLSSLSPTSVISLLHASFDLMFGRPFLLFPGLAFFSLCAPLSFSSHGRTTSVVFL